MAAAETRIQSQNLPIPALSEVGTPIAKKTSDRSARRPTTDTSPLDWGGARNSAARKSSGLSARQAMGIVNAARAAWQRGLAFNCHVTIDWSLLGVDDADAAKATGAFLTRVRDWLRKQGEPFAYAYVRENGHKMGSHVHILAHMPPGYNWAYHRSLKWLEGVTGKPYRKGAIRTTRIRGTERGKITSINLYQCNLANVVDYLIKGVLPDVARVLHRGHVFSGVIVGKRAGCSQNIS